MFQSDAEAAALVTTAVAAVVLHMNDHIEWKEDKKNGHPMDTQFLMHCRVTNVPGAQRARK
jgi:hypothetical protein